MPSYFAIGPLGHWHEPDDPARHRRDETVVRSCARGVVDGEVHVAVRSLDHVANAAVLIEDHFLPRDAAAGDFETAQGLPGETADEQARILPRGIAIACQERDARWCERRDVIHDRLVHPRLRALGDPGLGALGRDSPSVVVSALDDIDLVASRGPVLRFPEPARDGIPREALRVAMAVAPD